MSMLEQWMTDYLPTVYRAAYLILRDHAKAQDVAQETFIRAHLASGRLREGSQVAGWLYRIAVNTALNEVRSRGRESRAYERLPGAQAPDAFEIVNTRSALRLALDKLPVALRAVIVMRYYLDLPESEIAAAMRIRPGTVKSRLHRARTLLAADESLAKEVIDD